MIEREFIKEKVKYLKAKEYVIKLIPKSAGIGKITIEKTPMGERITIETVKPGLIIGRGGKTIADLTLNLKTKFGMENPQVEVREIINPNLSASVIASRIAGDLERFGPSRFKAIGYKALTDVMNAGALGAEIKIGGRGVPGSRAQSWRFPAGYMKKCGNVAMQEVDIAIVPANLRTGTVGIQVMIMPPTIQLPDRIKIREQAEIDAVKLEQQKKDEKKAEEKSAEVKDKKLKAPRASKKKAPAEQTASESEQTENKQEVKEVPKENGNTPSQ